MASTPERTPLHAWHAAQGGRLVDFAGWSMPVQYTSIVVEHNATRRGAGLFDISHMGRLLFDGSGARAFLDGLLTRRVSDLKPGQIRYSLVTDDNGGILDDVLIYHVPRSTRSPLDRSRSTGFIGESYYVLVVNASNRQKIVDWIKPRLAGARDVEMTDATHSWAMIAVQGPKALEIAQPLVELPLESMKYYTAAEAMILLNLGIVSRTGYTGEDGVELIVDAAFASEIWRKLVSAGATPAGLGCRDTLRLEAGMPLYGHELSEQINPYMAGLGFAVNLEGRSFPGRDALARFKDDPQQPHRIGLELAGLRLPREGFAILHGSDKVGQTTSGTFSPSLQKPIAMGYVRPEFSRPGTSLAIEIRGTAEPASVVKLPFYRRA